MTRIPRIVRDFFNLILLILLLLVSCWALSTAIGQPAPGPSPLPTAPAPTTRPTTQPLAWPDRRPIGVIFLSEVGYRTKANPRGWNPNYLKDAAGQPIDVHDPDYAAKFDTAVDAFVMQSFDRAATFHCQGVLFWDVEGSEYDHPVTYQGTGGTRLPSEMKQARVRAWVDELQRRGMWAGFTFRDTNLVSTPSGPDQQTGGDPAAVLIWKMQGSRFAYGNNVRGAYIDTFCEPDSWADGKVHPRPAAVLATVQSKLANWLLIPEFGGPGFDQVPRVYPIRQQLDTGLLAPSMQAAETLQPFYGLRPQAAHKALYAKALRNGALTLVTVTWPAADTEWVPGAVEAAGK